MPAALQKKALRQNVGMKRRLRRGIDRRDRHRDEAEHGAGIGDDGVVLALQVLDQGRRHADRPHQIGVHRIDQQLVVDPAGGPVGQHDAGVVDQHVEIGMVGDQPGCHGVDAGGIGDIEFDRLHAGVGGDDLVEMGPAAAGNDHLVAALVKSLGERPADAGRSAGDENGVACEFHDASPMQVV